LNLKHTPPPPHGNANSFFAIAVELAKGRMLRNIGKKEDGGGKNIEESSQLCTKKEYSGSRTKVFLSSFDI
jgi:hypothetical protein